ncbi:MAG: DUF998 domain-containing protein [Methanomassiliicoccales archaeon]|nr:DUF998 domain-containing protein [Methanomassiliicoccales archaeon]
MASLEVLFLVHVAEFLYPSYSVSQNYISDLGVGPEPSRGIFTVALIVFGAMVLMAAALIRVDDKRNLLWLFFGLSGLGALGVGVFNEDTILFHTFFAMLAFVFGNIAAVYSFTRLKPPFSWFSVILGLLGLSALILLGTGNLLGIGAGGMERVIFYSGIFWALAYGAHLLTDEAIAKC